MKLSEYAPELTRIQDYEHRLGSLLSQIDVMKSASTNSTTYQSPTLGLDTVVNTWLRHQMAYRQQMVMDLYTIAITVEEIRAPIHHITSEVFRKGISWKPKFAVKCSECATEHQDILKKCTVCQSVKLTSPNESQKKNLDSFLTDSNIWDNSLEEILRALHFDINVLDDGFLYLAKEYAGDTDLNASVHSRITEIRRLHPALVEFDLDDKGLPKNKHFICYLHRDVQPASVPGFCEVCSRRLVPAMYKYYHRGLTMYLLDSEVLHVSKFSPTETYGWSPVLTIFEKALTIMGMDKNLYRYFYERKMPSSMVMVFTDDPESLRRERADMAAKLKLDPNYIPLVAVSARQNRGRVDMIRLYHTLQEMDYIPVRQEIRERIAAMWGVTPAWQGAPEAFGGLSTQTQQLVVMSRVVEGDQRLFHQKVFPYILDAFGITDWLLELPQPEEKAEATRISMAQQKISAANMLFQMGFDIKVKSQKAGVADIDFMVSGEAKRQDMFGGGGFGGMPQTGREGEQETQMPQQQEMPNNLGLMKKAEGVTFQIIAAGYDFPIIKQVSDDFSDVWFVHKDIDYVAKFDRGKLLTIEKATFRNLHAHGGYPPHNVDMSHDTMAKHQPREDAIFEPEDADTE